jgi:nitrate/TMAO reductase-like tetraheme cytochrome c subunit
MNKRNSSLLTALLASTLVIPGSAFADGVFAGTNAKWKTECGSCHVAYPAQLLPATSWQRLMKSLDKHFGTDASVDAATAAEISTFLEKYSGSKRGITGETTLRVSETSWFQREHRKVDAATWKNPKVKSAANCAACHTNAEAGDYSERGIRIPQQEQLR